MPNPGRSGEHYFSSSPGAPSERRTVPLHLPDLSLQLVTDRGVFSGDRVDPGTKLLLSEVPVADDVAGDVLDLGCGYGAIAVTLARRAPATTVWAVDVNGRARGLAAENARAAGVGDRVRVVAPDEVPPSVTFTAIWSNPPIRVGKAALHELLLAWLPRLRPDVGRAWLVVQKHLGSDSLSAWLRTEGYDVDRRTSRMGYRILEVAPPS